MLISTVSLTEDSLLTPLIVHAIASIINVTYGKYKN